MLFHEELTVQSHSWCEDVRVNCQREKVEAFQIRSADFSSAISPLMRLDRGQRPVAAVRPG
jgi:hypothetical protein